MKLLSVSFRETKNEYYQSGTWDVTTGDMVLVETDDGIEIGEVTKEVSVDYYGEKLPSHLREIKRAASGDDLKKLTHLKTKEREFFRICCEKILKHNVSMLLKNSEILFDESKVIFNYYAEDRVDFRELVKDLAETLHCRIEMHQIGEREKAGMLSGVGSCGKIVCCSGFIKEFQPVTLRMAKEQSISFSSDRLLGLCGKLKCCLRFEVDLYGTPQIKNNCNNCTRPSVQNAQNTKAPAL